MPTDPDDVRSSRNPEVSFRGYQDRCWPFATGSGGLGYVRLFRPLAGDQQTFGERAETDATDPLRKWDAGALTPAEYRSNMNVINISAKKSELDLARRRRHACNIDALCTTEKAHETCTKDCACSFCLYVCGIAVLRLV